MTEITQSSKGSDAPRMGKTVQRPIWVLYFSITVRAVHQLGAAIFLTAFLFADFYPLAQPFFMVGVVSGIVLLAAEAIRHREIYREVSGLVTVSKCLLLGAAYHGLLPATGTVVVAFIIASIGAHSPKPVRHRLLF